MKEPTIYVNSKSYNINEALKILTDEWVDDGNYSAQTVIDLRDAVEFYKGLFEASWSEIDKLKSTNKELKAQVSSLKLEAYKLQNEINADYYPLA
jgi:hypothetical protein